MIRTSLLNGTSSVSSSTWNHRLMSLKVQSHSFHHQIDISLPRISLACQVIDFPSLAHRVLGHKSGLTRFRALRCIPRSVVLWAMPQGQVFEEFDKVNHSFSRIIQKLTEAQMTLNNVSIAKKAKVSNVERDLHGKKYASLFHWIVNSDMPESELADERLAKEAQVILSAGSTSTARTLSHITYYILANPPIRSRLQEELSEIMAAWPEKVPSWVDLEGVHYLQALLKEGLR